MQSRKMRDIDGMRKIAPNVVSEELDGETIWYEWIQKDGERYRLVYWFDGSQYNAAVLEGLEHCNELLSFISPHGTIDINGLGSNTCSGILEARERAIEALDPKSKILSGENQDMTDQKMRIMLLGFSNAGKTFYLGSLGKLANNPGAKGFSLQVKDYIRASDLDKMYKIVAGDKEGSIPTTVDLRPHLMVLKRGLTPVAEIEITDIEGQALEPGRSIEIAEKIAKQIGGYDGLILIVEAPKTPRSREEGKRQLTQMLNFAGEVLKRNKQIPMSLVLTKIDGLPGAKEAIANLKDELSSFESNLKKKYKNFGELRRQRQSEKGAVVNKYVKEFINTEEIFELYNTFFSFLRPTSIDIPNKVFVCTSLGLNSPGISDENGLTIKEYREQQVYEPYGSAASFLWTVYARLLSQDRASLEGLIESGTLDSLKDDLLEEIRELHTSGHAYFDPENDSPQSNIWALRNISNLRSHLIDD